MTKPFLNLLHGNTVCQKYGYTSEQIARAMYTDINLVALKVAHLAETGYDLRRIDHRSDFLK